MFTKTAVIALLASALGAVRASPIAAGDPQPNQVGYQMTEGAETLVVTKVEPYGNGTLVYWSSSDPATPAPESGDLTPRACGTNDITCSGDHQANFFDCYDLTIALGNDGNSILPESPRSVCYKSCCTSWSQARVGIRKAYLVFANNRIISECGHSNTMSGLARNVNLNQVCMTQCMSNRPTGCN
ncbi:hypothetical protein GP486_002883 [Trichoglossum hirsutum]|uniref:WD-like domain-containing protein n=1 Tax=Trichoglossum hirsutum TaxID=265104 RepID=A0A9P8LE39_9PEZI|nr:hypothetical protein GP486_002883 [Trichoglossum hirsutum]